MQSPKLRGRLQKCDALNASIDREFAELRDRGVIVGLPMHVIGDIPPAQVRAYALQARLATIRRESENRKLQLKSAGAS